MALAILRRVERLTTAQAAHRLGVSQTQIRRLVASGRLRAEMVERPQGTRLFVLWDTPDETPERSLPDAPSTPQATRQDAPEVATEDATPRASAATDVAWLQERLEQAETERAELRRMLNLEQQTVAALRADLAAAHATLRALDAPGTRQGTPLGWPPDVPTPRTPTDSTDEAEKAVASGTTAANTASKRGFWARLRGR